MNFFLKIFRIQLLKFYIWACHYAFHWNLVFEIFLIQYFTQNLFIFYVNSIQYNHLITVETIIWLCSYIREIYVLYLKIFCFVVEPLSSKHQNNKSWQSCFNAVFSTSKQRQWADVDSTFLFNQILTLKQHLVINIEST